MKRIFFALLFSVAGCGGGSDCRCDGEVPGGHLAVACGHSQCVGGAGYHCTANNKVDGDPAVCSAGTPDLGGAQGGPDLSQPSGSCSEGDPCVVDECNYGTTHCEASGARCLSAGSYADGTPCSKGACVSGICSKCAPNTACTTSDGCHSGYTYCDASGNPVCESDATLRNGTECGSGKVCSNGSCVTCNAGASCSTSACSDGVIDCSTGAPYCTTTVKPNGTACDTSKVCDNGSCIACVEGADCTPTGTCHLGKLHCSTGAPVCMDLGGTAGDGTSCGYTGYVCKTGTCQYCAYPGSSCTPTNVCKTGAYSCDTGSPVCHESGNVSDGTYCSADHVCAGGSCVACKAGVACTPANPCHKGLTSCSTGASVCADQTTNAADGTNCGTNMFCKTGVCGACTPDAACSTGDPCQTGKTTCATGTSVCIPSGATVATTCGNVTKGTCVAGACQCPAGTGFYNGDCQTCAAASSSSVVVNANPSVGADNQCCGRSNTSGFGGPCLTIGQAIANVTPGYSITVTGDPQGNASSAEKYPIHINKNLSLQGTVCLKGAANKAVVQIDGSGTNASFYYFTVGTDCAGNAGGASDGIYVGPGAITQLNTTIRKTVNGIHVDGGNVSINSLSIDGVSGDGVYCKSETTPASTSSFGNGGYYSSLFSIAGAAKHDIFASTNCVVSVGTQVTSLALGDAAPCPASKRDAFGLYAEGNASVTVNGAGRISCMTDDGISLRNNAGLATNAPVVNLDTGSSYSMQITHGGCAGLYAEVGTLTAHNAVIESNHWGVVQHSSAASGNALVSLASGANTLACNSHSEPGTCSAGGAGADLFNNSGLALDASGNKWQDSPITVCNCSSALQSCACTPGGTTPPDGIDVLNAPLSSGTPSTNLANFTTVTVSCS